MYDPTIYDNLKVAFENHIYDLDNLEQKISIMNRIDRMDYAILARDFMVEFALKGKQDVTAEIRLSASLKDLSNEILEVSGENPGCSLSLIFNKQIENIDMQCKQIEQALNKIWGNDVLLTQTLSYTYGGETSSCMNQIEVRFTHQINEEHMDDIEELIDHVLETLAVLIRV